MSREDGFAIADVDSSYFEDAKLRALWRLVKNESLMAKAVCMHQAALLASWRQGERVSIAEAAPLWLEDDAHLFDALRECGLLDDGGRIPEAAFDEWFGAASARREVRRASGRAGGLASGKQRSTKRQPKVKQPLTDAEPVRPSVPSVPTDRPQPARDGLPNLDSTVARVWEEATGRSVLSSGAFASELLDDACKRHPVYEVCAALLRARKGFDHVPAVQPMAAAVRAILDPFVDPKQAAAAEREREERAQRQRAVEVTLRQNHEVGGHEQPHPRCPLCQEAAVTA